MPVFPKCTKHLPLQLHSPPNIYLSSMDAKAVGIIAAYQDDGLSLQALSLEVHYVVTQLSIPLWICS